MSETESKPEPPVPDSPFPFSLWTVLLVFAVLGSSLAVFGERGIIVFALVAGLAICIRLVGSLWWYLALVVFCLMCLYALLPAVQSARESSRHMSCLNNMKQIALALHGYQAVHGCFPPAYVADKDGKPMHSWRVLLLPYLECESLYKTYDFNQPWDAPDNKRLLAARPRVYACPSDPSAKASGATQTSYVAVVGPNAAWPGEKSRSLDSNDFAGGQSRTVMLVEVADSGIAWTEPRDLSLDAIGSPEGESAAPLVSGKHGKGEDFFFIYDRPSGLNVAMADGSVHYLPPGSFSTEGLRKMLRLGGFTFDEQDGNWPRATAYGGARRLNWPNLAALAVWLLSVGGLLTQAVRSRSSGN